MEIINIPEAFVSFCADSEVTPCAETNAGCVESPGACYPLNALSDLHFQVLLGDFVGNEVDLIITETIKFYITLARTCDECQITASDNPDNAVALLHAEPWKTTGGDQNDFWVLSVEDWINTSLFDAYSDGDCLVLCLWKVESLEGPAPTYEATKLGCSPCFIRTDDPCDTSVLYYRNNENSFGFYNNGEAFYNTYYNSIRLAFKLQKPQPQTKKNVYRKSDGNYIKNSATKAREWEGLTELISELWHMKLDIALDCDNIKITNINSGFSQKFFSSEQDNNYKIDWLDAGPTVYPHAQATFKLMEMPFNEFNNNCNIDPVIPTGVIIDDQDGDLIGSVDCSTVLMVKVYDANGNLLTPTFALAGGILSITGIETAMIRNFTGVTTSITDAAFAGKTVDELHIVINGTEVITINDIASIVGTTVNFVTDWGGAKCKAIIF